MVAEVSLTAVMVVFGMSVVTFATKAGGFWAIDRIEPGQSTRDALDALPGGIIVSILTIRLLEGGPAEWVAGIVVVLVARSTENVLIALIAGMGTLVLVRWGRTGF
ncbi:AzlD domain-containing protein [Halomicroarcula sp. F13]|uniref:AzlD domain-containing protein n=1 Tax=Haloarcula rubra TaxID=2487747 RepID=A0AAW4PW87_9EURY|nr:AzlD domain-containing protein [Halomicroarcula rubra]MBX0324374.1 AzlD domain-containing protein [Halomicroarcula rubra]